MAEHPLSTLNKIDPAMMKRLEELDEFVYGSGALPRKIKLLIAMAFDAAHGAENGVRSLAAAAIQEGATTEEIAEVLRVAYHLSGVGTLYIGSIGLKDVLK
ncbi:MAG: carboxymuconolactone decarboxylase family protein [Deltaproteobacteria bacterium]|jgi:alkylhydroperoxidase/carboxymuconolactone decarboxylase family protein YurZ